MKKYTAYSDQELVELLGKGNAASEAAFTVLYDRYATRVYAYIIKIVNNREQAEDIFQETFLRFHKNASDTKSGSIIGFFITIARNLCLNYKRDKKQALSIEEFDFASMDYRSYEQKELMELVRMAIDVLEMELREPLVLRVYNGLEYDEIAELCGITKSNARLKVFRAKEKIKYILSPYLKDLDS